MVLLLVNYRYTHKEKIDSSKQGNDIAVGNSFLMWLTAVRGKNIQVGESSMNSLTFLNIYLWDRNVNECTLHGISTNGIGYCVLDFSLMMFESFIIVLITLFITFIIGGIWIDIEMEITVDSNCFIKCNTTHSVFPGVIGIWVNCSNKCIAISYSLF